MDDLDRVTLYEEYRLIERSEPEVNGAWKGAHLLLFFLAFVFGSFCTFCFHMLMYLFDEKCVLFPKLMSVNTIRQNIIYEFIRYDDKDSADTMPVDFLSAQWVEKSACLLPTYVPLVSGIFGLVWTTMFLMYSIESRVLTGLQRPWRVLPPVFLFSLVMGALCVYTSTVTHYGLQELCTKLSEITGSSCGYTVNVATLAYQRRIRGVYQATRLTIITAWLHTGCWVLSALLALARVLLVVDFKLVRVSVQLQGNIERMLERHERHIRTVTAESVEKVSLNTRSRTSIKLHFMKKQLQPNFIKANELGDLLYYAGLPDHISSTSLVPIERYKLDELEACRAVPKEHQFIVKILYSILGTVIGTELPEVIMSSTSSSDSIGEMQISRQYGQQKISSTLTLKCTDAQVKNAPVDYQEAEEIALEIRRQLKSTINRKRSELNEIYQSPLHVSSEFALLNRDIAYEDKDEASTSKGRKRLKPSLKSAGIQTDEERKDLKVQIDSRTDVYLSQAFDDKEDEKDDKKKNKETQTKKEKRD